MIFLLLFTAGILLVVHHYWSNRELYKLSRQMPGPLALPLIGNAYSTLGVSNDKIYDYLQYLSNSFEKPMRFWLGPKLFVFVSAPDDMQAILNSQECLSRDDVYDYIKCFTGDGLVTLRGTYKAREAFQMRCNDATMAGKTRWKSFPVHKVPLLIPFLIPIPHPFWHRPFCSGSVEGSPKVPESVLQPENPAELHANI